MGIEKWFVCTDVHRPYHDPLTERAVNAYLRDNGPWHGWINLGDLVDFCEISSYVVGKPGDVEGTVEESFLSANAYLDEQEELVRGTNPNAKMVLIEGNHEHRVLDYLAKHPELKGSLEVPKNLRLSARHIKWIPYASTYEDYTKGNATFIHGYRATINHAKLTVAEYGSSVYYGHTHDVQECSLVQKGRDKVIVGKSLGCLCLPEQRYMGKKPSKWQQAFAVFYFFPDGYYTEHTVRIFKNRFVAPEGKVYDGSYRKRVVIC